MTKTYLVKRGLERHLESNYLQFIFTSKINRHSILRERAVFFRLYPMRSPDRIGDQI